MYRTQSRALRALTRALVLALLTALLLAGTALAAGPQGPGKSAKPGKPVAKAPSGAIASATPSFTWSKASGAAKYELRVYQGSTLLLTKTGIRQRVWTSMLALPTSVDLSWKVRASNARGAGAWSKRLGFRIVPPSPAKAITAFSFQGLTPPVAGAINEAAHTIALTVPYGTPVNALVATFTTSGAAVAVAGTPQVSGTTANNFANPVTYTVTAADASTQAYTVTVTVAGGPTPTPTPTPTVTPTPSPAKAITAFSFQGLTPPVAGAINEAAHTIALTVPYGTPVSALVATFSTSGASVAVGGTPQVSGTTANNFANPVTYTVTAADASTQAYTVTVTVAALAIGDAYQGGKVAYIDGTGQHGFVAAPADQSTGIIWAVSPWDYRFVPGGTYRAIGRGALNTMRIIYQNGIDAGSTYAAGLAAAYRGGGYSDWYLPSQLELAELYAHRAAIGGFEPFYYWSSSEYGGFDASLAWDQYFVDGAVPSVGNKFYTARVRAVRSF